MLVYIREYQVSWHVVDSGHDKGKIVNDLVSISLYLLCIFLFIFVVLYIFFLVL